MINFACFQFFSLQMTSSISIDILLSHTSLYHVFVKWSFCYVRHTDEKTVHYTSADNHRQFSQLCIDKIDVKI